MKLTDENRRLNECLEQILKEIEEKGPLLQRQREEYEEATEAVSSLSQLLEKAMKQEEETRTKLLSIEAEAQRLQRENKSLRQDTIDLSRQVQMLVSQVEGVPPTPAAFAPYSASASASGTMNASQVISDRLVTFKDIQELQEKNAQLLRLVRELSDDRETGDTPKQSEARIKELTKEIEDLRENRKRQQAIVESIVRQRDMYAAMLKRDGKDPQALETGSPFATPSKVPPGFSASILATPDDSSYARFEKMYHDVQAEFDTYRKEKEQIDKLLQDELDKLRRENSDYRVQLAKDRSHLEHVEERMAILQKNFDAQDEELRETRKKNSEYSALLVQHQRQLERSVLDLVAAREDLDRSKIRVVHLESEKELWKSSESRLSKENASLSKEVSRRDDLLRNLQAMQQDLQSAEVDSKARLSSQVETLAEEIQSLKKKLDAEADKYAGLVARKELEAEEYRKQVAKLTTDFHTTREELVRLQVTNSHLAQMNETLTAQVTDLKSRLAPGIVQREGQEVTLAKEEVEAVNKRLQEVSEQLQAATVTLAEKERQLEQYKAIATSCEDTLAEHGTAHDAYKESTQKKLEEQESLVQGLSQREQELNSALAKLNQEAVDRQTALEGEIATLTKEAQELKAKLERFQQFETTAAEREQTQQEALRRVSGLAEEAREQYQRQVLLHGRDVELLKDTKEQLSQAQRSLEEARLREQGATGKLQESEKSWQEQRRILQRDIEELEQKATDVTEQNNILLNQLENLSQNKQPRGENLEEMGAQDSGLSEVVRYLRREKDILQLQVDSAQQESKRLKGQLEVLNRTLDDAKLQLREEREQSKHAEETSRQHGELLQKINELNILRESNSTLREETRSQLTSIERLEARIKELERRVEPLVSENKRLEAAYESSTHEVKLAQEDSSRWRTRTQQLLEKYDRIDPVEFQQLKDAKAELELGLIQSDQQMADLKKEIEALREQISTIAKETQAKGQEEVDKFRKIAQNWKTKHDSLQKTTAEENEKKATEITSLRDGLAVTQKSLETETTGKNTRIEDLEKDVEAKKTMIEKYKIALKKQKDRADEEQKKAAEATASATASVATAAAAASVAASAAPSEADRKKMKEDVENEFKKKEALTKAMNEKKVKQLEAELQSTKQQVEMLTTQQMAGQAAARPPRPQTSFRPGAMSLVNTPPPTHQRPLPAPTTTTPTSQTPTLPPPSPAPEPTSQPSVVEPPKAVVPEPTKPVVEQQKEEAVTLLPPPSPAVVSPAVVSPAVVAPTLPEPSQHTQFPQPAQPEVTPTPACEPLIGYPIFTFSFFFPPFVSHPERLFFFFFFFFFSRIEARDRERKRWKVNLSTLGQPRRPPVPWPLIWANGRPKR